MPYRWLNLLKTNLGEELMMLQWYVQKGALALGRARDLLVFIHFLFTLKQRLRPLGYCSPYWLMLRKVKYD